MKTLGLSALSIAIITAIAPLSFAEFSVKIPLEASSGGSLPNGSISIADRSNGSNEGGNGGENGSTEPTNPTDPTEPVEPTEPESKPRSLVFSGNFATFSGESSLWTEGKQAAFATSSYTLVIKGALTQNKTYYLTNNGKECAVIADVCETIASQNRCGPFTSKNLSGTNTILSLQGAQDRSCVGVNSLWGQPVVNGLQVFDGPKPE
ncbi:hypothetical protein N0614_09440 [Pseudomonas aeruginosa]|nr:hypothetical protein [Pseudomonas aeruginosa]